MAQNTISAGLMSCVANSGAFTSATVDGAYVTAVFGTNAFIQDDSGGVYLYKALSATQGISGLAVGTLITGLGSGGFYYYNAGTQFEFEPTNSSTAYTYATLTAGTYQSIPASFYSSLTLPVFNSSASQGNATSPGMQNQLVTLSNVTLSNAGSTFAAGSYTMTDADGVTGKIYVSSASPLVTMGAMVPTGLVNVSGILHEDTYMGTSTSELEPAGAYDFQSVPEPSTDAVVGTGLLGVVLGVCRSRRTRLGR